MAYTTKRMHYFYLARCGDGTLYSGYTTDLKAREQAHNEGKGAKYTRARTPVVILYSEEFSTKSEAMQREAEVKKWSRVQKEELLA